MALLFVVTYYVTAYHPGAHDPKASENSRSYSSLALNPIDEYLLFWRLGHSQKNGLTTRLAVMSSIHVKQALTNV